MNSIDEKKYFFKDDYLDGPYLVVFKANSYEREQFKTNKNYYFFSFKNFYDENGIKHVFYYYCKLFFNLNNLEKFLSEIFEEQKEFFKKENDSIRVYKVGDKIPIAIKTRAHIIEEDYLELEDI